MFGPNRSRPKTILFVDNNEVLLDAGAALLETHHHYKVTKAKSFKEALNKAKDRWFHLVIIDSRLTNDQDESDLSGIELALHKDLDIYPKIIYTGWTEDALQELIEKHFGELPKRLRVRSKLRDDRKDAELIDRIVNDAFRLPAQQGTGEVGINFDQEITSTPGLTSLYLAGLLLQEQSADHITLLEFSNEILDIFGKAFPGYNTLSVSPMSQGRSGSFVLVVTPIKNESAKAPLIVKCGDRQAVLTELKNYREHVQDVNHAWVSHLVGDITETLHLGLLKYHIAGGRIGSTISFAEFYRRNSDSTPIKKALRHLFKEAMEPWYSSAAERQSRDYIYRFFEERVLFSSRSNLTEPHALWLNMSEAINNAIKNAGKSIEIRRHDARIEWKFGEHSYDSPDPYSYIGKLRDPDSRDLLFPKEYLVCRCHGDLHADNIRVDNDPRTWLIDFEHTGWGPLVHDPVELESSIRFALVDERQIEKLLRLEDLLSKQTSLSDSMTLPDDLSPAENPEIAKAFDVILTLRHEAGAYDAQLSDYMLGLAYQALRVLKSGSLPVLADPTKLLPLIKLHALFVACACCRKLEELSKELSSREEQLSSKLAEQQSSEVKYVKAGYD